MPISVQKITEPVALGEGPHWDDRSQALFFVSISDQTIHKYEPKTSECTKTHLGSSPGFIVPVDGVMDQYVLGTVRKFLLIQWDGKEGSTVKILKELGEVDEDIPTTINDGKADPRGRVYTGTIGPKVSPGQFQTGKGSIYRLDGRGLVKLDDGVTISNGLAWDLKEKAFYYIDSVEHKIRRYDYDVDTGDISNKRYVFDFKEKNVPGMPDGMTIDTDGNLWVAVFGGSRVIKVDPKTGNLLQEVPIPAKQVTSATFGGPNLDILFVTTASIEIFGDDKPPGGFTFMVTGLGVKGYPNLNFKMP